MMGYQRIADRKLSVSAYMLLVFALKCEGLYHAMPEFSYGSNGKPFLSNYTSIYFNMSHCQGAVACILSENEVGVDIERIGIYDDEMAMAICNTQEYLWVTESINPYEQALRFTRLWTVKESIVKWRGTGIDGDVKQIGNGKIQNSKEYRIETYYEQVNNLCIAICTNTTNKNTKRNIEYEDKFLSFVEQPTRYLL
jgi:4'-phosphopantetheinyl transferase